MNQYSKKLLSIATELQELALDLDMIETDKSSLIRTISKMQKRLGLINPTKKKALDKKLINS